MSESNQSGQFVNLFSYLVHLPPEAAACDVRCRQMEACLVESLNGMFGVIRPRDLFERIGMAVPDVMDEAISSDLSLYLRRHNILFAPDPALHGVSFAPDMPVVISGISGEVARSRAFDVLVVLLRLGVIVAQSDDEVLPEEVDVLKQIIFERRVLSAEQRASLLLWLEWCLMVPHSIDMIRQDLSGMSEGVQRHVSRVLVMVAAADGVIDVRERDKLLRIHRALGLPEGWVDAQLSALVPSSPRSQNVPVRSAGRSPEVCASPATSERKPAKDDIAYGRGRLSAWDVLVSSAAPVGRAGNASQSGRVVRGDDGRIKEVEIPDALNQALSMLCDPLPDKDADRLNGIFKG